MHTPAKSSSLHHKILYHELEKRIQLHDVNEHKKTSAITALHQIAESIHKRSLVMIFSDMMDSKANADELFSALQHLNTINMKLFCFM